jgi:hypothetical protein
MSDPEVLEQRLLARMSKHKADNRPEFGLSRRLRHECPMTGMCHRAATVDAHIKLPSCAIKTAQPISLYYVAQ